MSTFDSIHKKAESSFVPVTMGTCVSAVWFRHFVLSQWPYMYGVSRYSPGSYCWMQFIQVFSWTILLLSSCFHSNWFLWFLCAAELKFLHLISCVNSSKCFSFTCSGYEVNDLVRIQLTALEAAGHFLGQDRHITLCESDATLVGKLTNDSYIVTEKELNWLWNYFSLLALIYFFVFQESVYDIVIAPHTGLCNSK